MEDSLSKSQRVTAPEKELQEFHLSGKAVRTWAMEYGFNSNFCYDILKADHRFICECPGEIAVRLGIMDEVIEAV